MSDTEVVVFTATEVLVMRDETAWLVT